MLAGGCAMGGSSVNGTAGGGKLTIPISVTTTHPVRVGNPYPFFVLVLVNGNRAAVIQPMGYTFLTLVTGTYMVTLLAPNGAPLSEYEVTSGNPEPEPQITRPHPPQDMNGDQ